MHSASVWSLEIWAHIKRLVWCGLYTVRNLPQLHSFAYICLLTYIPSIYLFYSCWIKPRVSHMLDKCHNNQPHYYHSCLLMHALYWEPYLWAILWRVSFCPCSSQTIFYFILVLSRWNVAAFFLSVSLQILDSGFYPYSSCKTIYMDLRRIDSLVSETGLNNI